MMKNVITKILLSLSIFITNKEILAQDFFKTPTIPQIYCKTFLFQKTISLVPMNASLNANLILDYKPMLNKTSWFWAVNELEGDILNYYKTVGESTIDGLKYNIIENQFISNQTGSNGRITKTYFMLREDTISQKVYYRDNFEERILYDFSIQIGQSMTGYIWNFLRKIDTVETGLGKRRRFTFSTTAHDTSVWIESIGNIYNPFMPFRPKDEYGKLICSQQNGQLSYEVRPSLRGITCDSIQKFFTATHEININSKVAIYPNPVSDQIQIVTEETLSKSEITLTDVLGRVVLKQFADIDAQSPFSLDIHNINTGIYFLIIKSGQQSAVKKIMKK